MLKLEGLTVAETKAEALEHLFSPSAPLCEITIERKNKGAVFFRALGSNTLFFVNQHKALGQASRLPNGKLWYQATLENPLGGWDNVQAFYYHFFKV